MGEERGSEDTRRALQASIVSSHHAPCAVISVLPSSQGKEGLPKVMVCAIPVSGLSATGRDFCFSVCQVSYDVYLLASFWDFVAAVFSPLCHSLLALLLPIHCLTSIDAQLAFNTYGSRPHRPPAPGFPSCAHCCRKRGFNMKLSNSQPELETAQLVKSSQASPRTPSICIHGCVCL